MMKTTYFLANNYFFQLTGKMNNMQRFQKRYLSCFSASVNLGFIIALNTLMIMMQNHVVSWRHGNALSLLKHSNTINLQYPSLSYKSTALHFPYFALYQLLVILFKVPLINKHFVIVLNSSLVTPCAALMFSLHQNITSSVIIPFMHWVRCLRLEKQSTGMKSYCNAEWWNNLYTHL